MHGISFVFVVFNDPLVLGIIDYLRNVFGVSRDGLPPHLTIQGPLTEPVTAERIKGIESTLRGDEFFIGNASSFSTDKGIAFFLRVTSPSLERVWQKRDFPVEKYGFNPHITIYEGPDIARVGKAVKFLKREPLEAICRNFEIVPHVSRQFELFKREDTEPNHFAIQHLMRLGKIGTSFDARFRAFLGTDVDPRPKQH